MAEKQQITLLQYVSTSGDTSTLWSVRRDGEEYSLDPRSVLDIYVGQARQRLSAGDLDLAGGMELVSKLINTLIAVFSEVDWSKGPSREALLAVCGKFWDEAITPIDIPYLPDALVDPIFKKVGMQICAGLIASGMAFVDRTLSGIGLPSLPKLPDAPAPTTPPAATDEWSGPPPAAAPSGNPNWVPAGFDPY